MSTLFDTWGPLRPSGGGHGLPEAGLGGVSELWPLMGGRGSLDKSGAVQVPGTGERALKGRGSGGPRLRSSSCLGGPSPRSGLPRIILTPHGLVTG